MRRKRTISLQFTKLVPLGSFTGKPRSRNVISNSPSTSQEAVEKHQNFHPPIQAPKSPVAPGGGALRAEFPPHLDPFFSQLSVPGRG